MDIVSALVTRLQNRFKPQIGTGTNKLFEKLQCLLFFYLYLFIYLSFTFDMNRINCLETR